MLPSITDLATAARLREGTYKAGEHTVYFQDGETMRDLADLYAVLEETAGTGSPNVENDLVRGFIEQVQHGRPLNDTQIAKLLEMRRRYADQLEAYRANRDPARDLLNIPDTARARILS